jgi:hypothetical protein
LRRHTSEGTSTRRGAVRLGTLASLAILALALASPGRAVSVLPGEAFEIDFGFSAAPLAAGSPVDLLVFGLAPTTTSTGLIGYDVELWDGGTLLATNSTGVELLWGFVSAASTWTQNPQVVSDFSSIVDGSIDGRIRLIPQFAAVPSSGPGASVDVVFFPPPGTGLDAGVALADGISFLVATPEPFVSATRVVAVAEPAVGMLLVAAGLAARRHRRR